MRKTREKNDELDSNTAIIPFLEDYVGGDKRIVISLLREENLTSWASDFNVYAFVKNNLESIESFINSTPDYEGQGKMMIVNGLKAGTRIRQILIFDISLAYLLKRSSFKKSEEMEGLLL